MESLIENVIEWINGDDRVTVTLSQRKHISKVKKLADKFPDDIEISHENKDGSIVAHLPLRAIKISFTPKRELTEEQKEVMRERLRLARESGQEVDDDDFDDED